MTDSISIVRHKASEIPEQYKALIFSKWLRSLRYGNPFLEKVESVDFYDHYHKFIESLLKKPGCNVRLAVLTKDHDVVLGFSVTREDVLDYVHVHKEHREQGIAKKLVPMQTTTFSHITRDALKIWPENDNYRYLKFNPKA